jgi:hypothetical protein
MGDLYDELGPSYNVSSDDPPTVAFFGDADIQVPATVSRKFAADMEAAGVRLDFYLYPGRLHGFDYYTWNNPYFYDTLRKTDQFFISLGWLSGQPTLNMPTTQPVDIWQAQSTITFNGKASPQAVQALMRNVMLTVPDNPGDKQRRITWQLDDGAGGVSNIATSYTRIVPTNDAPKLSIYGTATYTEGANPYVLAPGTVVSDLDSYRMYGASFTISSTGAWSSNDRLEIQGVGTGPRQISVANNAIYYEGTQIGTYGGGQGNTPLRAVFNDGTPRYAIEAAIRRVSFRTLGTDPLGGLRSISYVVSDGNDNGTSKPAYKYVQVVPVD